MADRTLTINHADGGSETYTINRDKFAGVRDMTVDGETVSVDHTAVPKEQAKETTFGGSQSITVYRDVEPLLSKVVGGAAAAYSLRDLNDVIGNGDKVVRVRRASDNNEKDFTASKISTGEMTNWVNSQIVPPLDIGVETANGRPSVPDGGTSIGTPAAAYSLRSLGEGQADDIVPSGDTVTPAAGAYVVQVRRSSDDAVQSFTASEVADGTLEDWVTAEQVGWNLQPTMQIASGGGSITSQSSTGTSSTFTVSNTGGDSFLRVLGKPNSILADAGDSVVVNISVSGLASDTLFRLYTSASNTSRALQAIGNGDNQELTLTPNGQVGYFGFTAFNTTTEATVTINSITVIGKSAAVRTWYDQSGSDNHAVQTTNASQPKIVDAGTYLGEINFPSSSATLGFSNIACGTTYSLFCALPRLGVTNFKILSGGGSAPRIDFERGSPDRIEVVDNNYGFNKFNSSNTFTDDDNLTSIINASTSVNVFYNGNASSTNPSTIPNANTFNTLGGQAEGGAYEVILYTSDQSDNRTAIEANIGEHYGITGIPAYDNTVDGFVETWYDQSGNGNDATQTVTANQPKIVDAGVLVSGGIDFDGVDDQLTTSSFISGSNFSAFSVLKCTDISSNENQSWNFTDNASEFYGLTFNRNAAGNVAFASTTPDSDLGEESYTGNKKLFSTFSGTSNSYYSNGTESVLVKLGRHSPSTGNTIGSQGTSGRYLEGSIEEIIVYNSDQSANRTAIEANINNQYSIY